MNTVENDVPTLTPAYIESIRRLVNPAMDGCNYDTPNLWNDIGPRLSEPSSKEETKLSLFRQSAVYLQMTMALVDSPEVVWLSSVDAEVWPGWISTTEFERNLFFKTVGSHLMRDLKFEDISMRMQHTKPGPNFTVMGLSVFIEKSEIPVVHVANF